MAERSKEVTLLTGKEVYARVKKGRSTVSKWLKNVRSGSPDHDVPFPLPIDRPGPNLWIADKVDAWCEWFAGVGTSTTAIEISQNPTDHNTLASVSAHDVRPVAEIPGIVIMEVKVKGQDEAALNPPKCPPVCQDQEIDVDKSKGTQVSKMLRSLETTATEVAIDGNELGRVLPTIAEPEITLSGKIEPDIESRPSDPGITTEQVADTTDASPKSVNEGKSSDSDSQEWKLIGSIRKDRFDPNSELIQVRQRKKKTFKPNAGPTKSKVQSAIESGPQSATEEGAGASQIAKKSVTEDQPAESSSEEYKAITLTRKESAQGPSRPIQVVVRKK